LNMFKKLAMTKVKHKYYIVWKGRQTGIFENWEDCSAQIHRYDGAVYKSFKTKQLAEQAFNCGSKEFIGKDFFESELTEDQLKFIGDPIEDSIAVDGALNTTKGIVEYQGVYIKTGEVIFRKGPYEDGTINIVEFLAIVHALGYCKKKGLTIPIYSDSRNAIKWVKEKETKTHHEQGEKNKPLFDMLDRAVKWLKENEYPNQLLKWETRAWGENPADFDRKR
jgi:ribonuclease HI